MDFAGVLEKVLEILQRQGRVSYWALAAVDRAGERWCEAEL
jgi:hypothetical protein